MRYTCKECGATCQLETGGVVKLCGHNESGVVAELAATCSGVAVVAGEDGGNHLGRVLAHLAGILSRVKSAIKS